MSEDKVYEVDASAESRAHLNNEQYLAMYQQSIDDPAGFWAEQANQFVSWFKPWDNVMSVDFHKADIRWFEGAELNVCYN